MAAKRQRKEKARENRTKEGLRTRVRISGETESSWLAQLTYSRLGEGREKKHIKGGAKMDLLSSLGSAHPQASRIYFPLLAK